MQRSSNVLLGQERAEGEIGAEHQQHVSVVDNLLDVCELTS
jgi:hypothetical protein